MVKWLDEEGLDEDVVISTRFRLARNLEDYRFPHIMSREESKELTDEIVKVFHEVEDEYDFYRIDGLGEIEKHSYVEDHLISHHLLKTPDISSFLLREDQKVAVMINEEDHLRIQTVQAGLNLRESYDLISHIDDIIDEKIEYAFDDKYGYKTACPTNVGTGLRASVMVHLPAITGTGTINSLMETMRKIGLTVRGLYGEGTEALGFLYQISNQTTLGQREEDIIRKMEKVTKQIITRERQTRKYFYEKKKEWVEDKVYRSSAILKSSRVMSSRESMLHLSNVKLGIDLGIIDGMSSNEIVKLMIKMQPANLQIIINKDMDNEERDIERASYIRSYFQEMEG